MHLVNISVIASAASQASSFFQILEDFNKGAPYLGAGIVVAIAIIMAIAMLAVGGLIRVKHPDAEKVMPYECGLDPIGDAMERVKPRYYVYAMLFLAFDIELLFIFPWAIVFKDMEKIGYGNVAFYEMVIFIIILFFGLIYAWMKGALEWD